MPSNPFNSDGTSLETNNPIVDTTVKAANATTAQTTQQAQAAKNSFVDQLYGNVSASADETSPNGQTASQPKTPTPTAATSASAQHAVAKTPAEQSQMDEARRKLQELQGQHNKAYYDVTFGEEAQRKRREEEEQERQMKLQEEQEEEQRKAEEKAQQDQSLGALQAPGKGAPKLSDPLAVTRARTTTEINRGSSG